MEVEIDGRRYIALRALFGGSLFPHYISTVMAAMVEILEAKGVSGAVMVDDSYPVMRAGLILVLTL